MTDLAILDGPVGKLMPKSNGTKIIVADDSPFYRKLVEQAFAAEDYNIYWARNGTEAKALFLKHRPSIVISDWEMPDFTGIALCGEIRRHQQSFTYVILLTSNIEKEHVVAGLRAGADDYLTKPFHAGELLARVAVGRRFARLYEEIETKNRLLEELARTDALTGLPNRRALEEWAARELSGALRYGFSFWVVLVDLDHFKKINDEQGHEAGDLVLKRFAEILTRNTRSSNYCGRIGGEEFVIILSHSDRQGVSTAIERLRKQLESEEFELGETILKVTASFGIAGLHNGEKRDFSGLLRLADAALYAAKRGGRNRLEFAL